MSMDANEFLFRNTTPSVKFPVIGSSVIGVITKVPRVVEETDPATREVKRWQNGQPKMQVVIDLATELRENADDDGMRTLWAKGMMQQAIREAVMRAGAKLLEVGGILQVTYSADKPTNLQPLKLYTAQYWPPKQGVEVPPTPWESQAPPQQAMQQSWPAPNAMTPAATAPTPWQEAERRAAEVPRYPVTPAAAPAPVAAQTSAPPAQVNESFLDKLRRTTANQQAYRDQATNHHGNPQDVEPPY